MTDEETPEIDSDPDEPTPDNYDDNSDDNEEDESVVPEDHEE